MLDLFQTNSCRVSGRLYFHPACGKLGNVKKAVQLMVGFLLFGSAVFPAQAAFTMLQVFGDGISATTNNPSPGPQYYGKRYTNGRVWVEVLAQRQGLTLYPTNNWSYYYNSSTTMLANVSSFQAPSGVNMSNILFVIWVNCADLWFPATYSGTSMNQWTNAINQSQTNHYKAATNLYARGARTLIMPNAVDVSTIPEFNSSPNTNFIHQRCLDYNIAFSNTLNRIRASCPNLTLYEPDFFTLLTNMLAHAANYGLTNTLCDGVSIDAIDAAYCDSYTYPIAVTNGYGTNYIFWNIDNPTAMVHAWMANLTQQLISPVQISNITSLNGSNQLVMANVPIGQNGLVLGRTNLLLGNWTTNVTFISSNATQSVFVTPSGPVWFYRLSFSYSWTWP
jgi:phospholipase/lecithinase/hemolysin